MTTKVTKKKGEVITPNFIRVETALKQFPFHLLDKHDDRKKLIVTMNSSTVWEVQFRAQEGAPRDLAYRIERLVIDAAIDVAVRNGMPPKMVRLGTLREICNVLGLAEGGDGKKRIRTALLQLHGTVIDVCSTVHARWSKYQSIYFTGDKREDGTRSDAVYVRLSDEYQKILADSPRRPLDYDYINNLPGAAARLYEVIAPRVFAAFMSGDASPVARMLYSEICNSVGIVRYPDRARMAKQVHKLHQPHLKSGYFAEVTYSKRSDDWMMDYIPGLKARQEFEAVMGRESALPKGAIFEVQALLPLPPTAPLTEKQMLAQRLGEAGVSLITAQVLADSHEASARLWLDVIQRGCLPKNVRDVGAYVAKAVATEVKAPEAYAAAIEAEKRRTAAPKVQRPTRKAVTAPAPEVDPLSALSVDELAELREEAFSAMTDRERRQIGERETDTGREALIRSKMIQVFAARAS